jgi:hypothetical protein
VTGGRLVPCRRHGQAGDEAAGADERRSGRTGSCAQPSPDCLNRHKIWTNCDPDSTIHLGRRLEPIANVHGRYGRRLTARSPSLLKSAHGNRRATRPALALPLGLSRGLGSSATARLKRSITAPASVDLRLLRTSRRSNLQSLVSRRGDTFRRSANHVSMQITVETRNHAIV